MEQRVARMLAESAAVVSACARDRAFAGQVSALAAAVIDAYRRGNKVLVFGNGGSAADAQHLAAELVGRFRRERRAFNALALTVNTSTLTAVGNDYGMEEIFARQVDAHAAPGDVVIGISTSGNAPDVLRGITAARDRGCRTVAMTGRSGGALRGITDLAVFVPSDETPRIQEAHVAVIHTVCALVEEQLAETAP